jgi:hypothetical protein
MKLGAVPYAYNPSYSGDGDQKDLDSRLGAKILRDNISRKK